ncbi:hypothetical protein K2Z84_23780 [Candidatus Binatia bacterium]|jgi:hypothetical protein|nr:hypothetical protein [Candidatus Binatia bacterium]
MAREERKSAGDGQATKGDGINREGARRYDEAVRDHARSGAPEREAREAAKALDGAEGEALRDAERQGKAAAHKRP